MAQSQDWRSWDWARIAAHLIADRGTRSRREVAAAAGIDEKSVYSLEQGNVPRRAFPSTLEPYARALGWKPGSVRAVGTGGEPERREVPEIAPVTPMTRAERDALVSEALADSSLANGRLRARLEALWNWPLLDTSTDGSSEVPPGGNSR